MPSPLKSLYSLALVFFLTAPLAAHEFWLWPETFSVTPGTAVRVGLRVGENFTGDARPFSPVRAAALRHYSAAGMDNLLARVPAAPGVDSLALVLAKPGTHLLAYDSQPSFITLPPDKFLAYLREDGLEDIAALRQTERKDQTPGRERYRRFVKTLILAGGRSDATFAVHTGQRLEIIPATDPLAAHAGSRVTFAILFEGHPLVGALVRAWHHRGTDLVVLKGRTAADGTVAFELSDAGPWMISLVHMLPLRDTPGFDWESCWGSLTFALGVEPG